MADQKAPEPSTMPRARVEIHHAPGALIRPGTLITDDVAKGAKLDSAALDDLQRIGAVEQVEIYKG